MEIEKNYVRIADGQIHYRSMAGDGTPLVMFHRNPSSSLSYERMMKLMAGERPVYSFDTPGFGASFDPKGMPNMLDYRDWMMNALDALRLDQVHVFAHHTGTHFATEMAAAHPDRILSLALNGIAYFSPKIRKKIKDEYGQEIPLDPDGGYVSEIWKGVREMFDDYDLNLNLLHAEFIAALRAVPGRHQSLIAMLEQDYKAPYAKVKCPILAMCAKDDVLEFCFEDAIKANANVKAVKLGSARFFSPELDTARTVDALQEFIASVEQG